MSIYKDPIFQKASTKAIDIISTSKTMTHLDVARKFVDLVEKRFTEESFSQTDKFLVYNWGSFNRGVIEGIKFEALSKNKLIKVDKYEH
jgi:hypothetical protein